MSRRRDAGLDPVFPVRAEPAEVVDDVASTSGPPPAHPRSSLMFPSRRERHELGTTVSRRRHVEPGTEAS